MGSYLLWNSGDPSTSASACDCVVALATVAAVESDNSPAITEATSLSLVMVGAPPVLPRSTGALSAARCRPACCDVRDTAKFMRLRRAAELTHASALSE